MEKNPIVVTSLTPIIGYEKASEIYKKALTENKTIREILIQEKILPPDKVDEYLSFEKMI